MLIAARYASVPTGPPLACNGMGVFHRPPPQLPNIKAPLLWLR